MRSISFLSISAALLFVSVASAEEHGRIRRPPPSVTEAARIASDSAMNDSLLQKGDIVVTDRGFLLFLQVAPDGITNQFVPIPNPGLGKTKLQR
jgi:hypothetical protein